MENSKFLEKAAQQALSELLGYDEGRMYYFLLKKTETEEEFSYSKRYRLLKNLFELGAVGKIKPEGQEFFNYFLLPPSFLCNQADLDIVNFLEELYLPYFKNIFENEFSQLILKNEKNLLIFLLKHFMKKEARLAIDLDINSLGEKRRNITFMNMVGKEKKLGTIDNNMAFEFFSLRGKDDFNSVGYIARNEGGRNYVAKIEREMG